MRSFFRSLTKPIRYLDDPPARIFFIILCPVLLVSILSIFVSMLANNIYSSTVGDEYYAVVGALSNLTTMLSSVPTGIASAAFILTSRYYAGEDRDEARRKFIQGYYAIFLSQLLVSLVAVCFTDLFFDLIRVPVEIRESAAVYFRLTFVLSVAVSGSTFFSSVSNATSGFAGIYTVNLFSSCFSVVPLWFFLRVLHLGIAGVTVATALTSLSVIGISVAFLVHNRTFGKVGAKAFLPEWKFIGKIVRYGALIFLQTTICGVAYLASNTAINTYLPLSFVSAIGLSLPLAAPLSAISSAVSLFFPPNFAAGKVDRMKKFLRLALFSAIGYATFHAAVYWLVGKSYFASHLAGPDAQSYGATYWKFYGIGILFCSLIFVLRFYFDAIGESKISLFASGFGEFFGNTFAAFVLIPKYGVIGGYLTFPLGWFCGGMALVVTYLATRKRIEKKCLANAERSALTNQ